MPPDLLIKTAFVRGEFEGIDKPCKESIRTDFILQNAYSYVLQDSFQFDTIHAKNKKEEFVLKELEDILNAFLSTYRDNIENLCLELDVSEDTINSAIIGVSNELFCEGITWSRIIALFVFVGKFSQLCLSRKFPARTIHKIYDYFYKLVEEKLLSWVDDHGGWEGLTTLSLKRPGNLNSVESPKSANSGWAKSLLYGTVRMVGTLAQIANSSNHVLP